jgi:hypothetical protein
LKATALKVGVFPFTIILGCVLPPFCLKAMKAVLNEPPPINEFMSGVTLDRLWTTLRRILNGKEALYGGADYRISAAS